MADRLSAAERAMIDAAVSAGRVQRVPSRTLEEFLRAPVGPSTGAPKVDGRNQDFMFGQRGAPRDPKVTARRHKIVEMARNGATVQEAVGKLGIDAHTVHRDASKMRVKFRLAKRRRGGRRPEVAAE